MRATWHGSFTTGKTPCGAAQSSVPQRFLCTAANGAAGRPRGRALHRLENRYVAPEGEIVEVIGPADRPSLDTEVVMKQFDLPEDFPAAVIDAAERVAQRLTGRDAGKIFEIASSSQSIRRPRAISTTPFHWNRRTR